MKPPLANASLAKLGINREMLVAQMNGHYQ